ncbi:MAG: hypothetical protein K1000chlam2_01378 [Chlamydiae bacterium]|nr:hypothetical protein [Chlamydiota bacterium]
MTSAVSSQGGFCQWMYPPIPERTTEKQQIAGDWCNITVHKRDLDGNIIKCLGTPIKFRHTQEISTGNLYGVEEKKTGLHKPHQIAMQAFRMFLAIPFYALGIMFANAIKIAIDLSAIFWRVIPNLINDLKVKAPLASLGHGIMTVVVEIPTNVMKDMWRIAKSPLYAALMMTAALFTMLSPLEGRKWLGEVEYEWHEKVSYRMDIRHGKTEKEWKELPPAQVFSELKAGKIMFLGYCMLEKGNRNDKRAGRPRYELVEEST